MKKNNIARPRFTLFIFIFFISFATKNTLATHVPCTGEIPDACGYLPSTYGDLGILGPPVACDTLSCPADFKATEEAEGGWDLCGICGGLADLPPQVLLESPNLNEFTRLGGSIANWNGTVLAGQFPTQVLSPLVPAPVVGWFLNHETNEYEEYILPWDTDGLDKGATKVPVGTGHSLVASENYVVIGSPTTRPRLVQLWTFTPDAPVPIQHKWTAGEFCAGNHFAYSVAIDERIPKMPWQNSDGVVAVGDPGAHHTGAVATFFTSSPFQAQTLYPLNGFGNLTEIYCYGESVSSDSGYLAVGSPGYPFASSIMNAGMVDVWKWNASAGLCPPSGCKGEYQYLYKIDPPSPLENGGFGESVSVFENELIIGDNLYSVYKYRLDEPTPTLLTLQQPTGLNLVSRLGYTVSNWDDFVVAGDEQYVVGPTIQGAAFVWKRDPLTPVNHLGPQYTLYDENVASYNTYYGAEVDVRGGCYVAAGVTAEDDLGGVFVQDMCNYHCYGCDGMLNSCQTLDQCDVCGGNNTTCQDCNGVVNGPDMPDACGVCAGTNSTCAIPYVVPPSIVYSDCQTNITFNVTHEFWTQYGPVSITVWTSSNESSAVVGATNQPPNGVSFVTYIPGPYQIENDTLTIQVTVLATGGTGNVTVELWLNTSCPDCFGVPGGPSRPDLCGVCDGNSTSCAGCDGIPNSGLVYDYCGVCDGNNSTCVEIVIPEEPDVDCTAQIFFELLHEPASTPVIWSLVGNATYGTVDISAVHGWVIYHVNTQQIGEDYFTVQATSLLNSSIFDVQNITVNLDNCTDCSGQQYGFQLVDLCGICGGDSSTCVGCDFVPNSGSVFDSCGVCGGNNSTCLDCFGVINGTGVLAMDSPGGPLICCNTTITPVDDCGVCGGDNSSCTGEKSVLQGMLIFGSIFFLVFLYSITRLWHETVHKIVETPGRIREFTKGGRNPANDEREQARRAIVGNQQISDAASSRDVLSSLSKMWEDLAKQEGGGTTIVDAQNGISSRKGKTLGSLLDL